MARDERLPQREVDVLLARQVDGGDAAQRVGDAARADLEPDLAQDAAERDDVADDRVGHQPSTCGRCRARGVDELRERLVAHGLDVLAVLEHRAERLLDDVGVDLLAAERVERHRPVDRLGDPGRLRQVEAAQLTDERRRLGGEALGDARESGS